MGLLNNIFRKYKEKRFKEYRTALDNIMNWRSFIVDTLNTEGHISRSVYSDKLKTLYSDASDAVRLNKQINLFSDPLFDEFKNVNVLFQQAVNSFESDIDAHNAAFLKAQVYKAREEIGQIEGHDLDDQQMMCIVKDAHNHNVVAGAGTGKTTTIIGKVKHLICSGQFKPDEILVLSYTRAAANEMKERLKRNTSYNLNVSTFHGFGYFILTEVENKKPRIFSDSPRKILNNEMEKLIKDPRYAKKLIQFIGNPTGSEVSDIDVSFSTAQDYFEYVQEHRPVTIKGENVRSYGEMHLANILAMNGVRYIYEQYYEYDTATKEYAQYKPDFYLPDYKIYIEYFGIDRNGRAPEWFEGDNPTQTYQEGIKWKRSIHKRYGTSLVECYAYEDAEGILADAIEEKLVSSGVELHDVTFEEVFDYTNDSSNHLLNTFVSSASSIISLARNRNVKSDKLTEVVGADKRAYLMAELVAPLYKAYEDYLSATNQIDFADMLNKAEKYILEGRYQNSFKCIIVDEYQDITASQYRLLKALRQSNDFDLFCVGDDWQSIYRFNGSDVSYIMDFEEFWGESELSRIETTYRFSQPLINVSSSFVMKNPRQIKKSIHSGVVSNGFVVSKIEGYQPRSAVQFMTDRMMYLPKDSTVFLIGRYTFDVDLLKEDQRLTVRYDTATQAQIITLNKRPDLKIIFYTAHRSKGLQADYAFILNNTGGTLGFPSKVEDNPLINLLLERADNYPYAEERRLFYVALTRARKHVYLVTIKGKESEFEQELETDYGSQLINETYICPRCGGKLRIKEGKFGKFLGCENYSTNNCKFTSQITTKSEF